MEKTDKIWKTGKVGEMEEIGEAGKTGKMQDNCLRRMCDGISPQKRVVVVIISLLVFAVMTVYMAVNSIFGASNPILNVEHIKKLNLPHSGNESINTLIFDNYDDEQ